MDIFLFDNVRNEVVLNEYEVLLVKEFSALWNNERNITEQDPTGVRRTRAYREFTYMYLAIDWQSVYAQDSEQEKHQAALEDSGLTDEEFNDPEFRAACRKYKAIQDSDRQIRLIKAAQGKCDELTDYFESGSDLMERNPITGAPIFKAKDVMKELSSVSEVLDELDELEKRVKAKKKAETGLRAGKTGGFTPKTF